MRVCSSWRDHQIVAPTICLGASQPLLANIGLPFGMTRSSCNGFSESWNSFARLYFVMNFFAIGLVGPSNGSGICVLLLLSIRNSPERWRSAPNAFYSKDRKEDLLEGNHHLMAQPDCWTTRRGGITVAM